jgi:hypothetical protein
MEDRGVARTLATDVDDVLVNISVPWVERAMLHPLLEGALSKAGLPKGELLTETVIGRPMYYLQTWLKEVYGLPDGYMCILDEIYRQDGSFYDDLPPTTFCQGIITALENTRALREVHVITHVYAEDDPTTESKLRWLNRWLKPDQYPVKVHVVVGSAKKSAVLKQHCPKPDVFADDAMKNVIDILLEDAVQPGEILIPRMGHNSPFPKDIETLAALRDIALTHYLNVT